MISSLAFLGTFINPTKKYFPFHIQPPSLSCSFSLSISSCLSPSQLTNLRDLPCPTHVSFPSSPNITFVPNHSPPSTSLTHGTSTTSTFPRTYSINPLAPGASSNIPMIPSRGIPKVVQSLDSEVVKRGMRRVGGSDGWWVEER